MVTNGKPRSTRNVYKGWVEGWDDNAKLFLVTFAEDSPALLPSDEGDSPFILVDEIARSTRSAVRRPNQQRFKFAVLKRYGPVCAVCDLAVLDLLQAAHLRWKGAGGSDDPRNGLVLCALLHLAYDRGLWAIEPSTLAVELRSGGPDAAQLRIARTSLRHLPKQPHRDALEAAWSAVKAGF